MSNNNCLSPAYSPFEPIDRSHSETCFMDTSLGSCLKENDNFLKSQVSLADTACDDNSPISQKF